MVDAGVIAEFERRLKALGQDVRRDFVRDAQFRWTKFVGDHPARETPLDVTIDNRLQAILLAVREQSVDLLVLGTHGETGPDVGTGPLAIACAREAPTSVLLVRPPQTGRFERVVACVDFSESSGRALEEAAAIAARDGGHLFALHVFHSPWNQLDYTPPALEPFADFTERYRRSVEQRLQDFCDKYRRRRRLCQSGTSSTTPARGSPLPPLRGTTKRTWSSSARAARLMPGSSPLGVRVNGCFRKRLAPFWR